MPDLIERSGEKAVIRSRVLRTWGVAESALAEMLADRIDELDAAGNPTLAFLASGVEGIKVRITAKAPTDAEAIEILDGEEAALRPILGEIVFGLDDQNMEAVVLEELASRGLTVAVAESLTGGYVAGRLCAAPGASEVFRGGVIAYQTDVKHDLLDVPAGPVVTEETALTMARSVRAQLGADVGLATTGVAGPDEVEGKPVGTVCLGVSIAVGDDAAHEVSTTVRLPGDRERIRQFSAISLLDLLRKQLAAS